MQINVSIEDKEVRDLLQRLQKKTGDMTPAMLDIGEIVRTSIRKNFDAGGRPKLWAKSKRAAEQGGVTLTKDATLKNSFTVRADSTSAIVATNVKYAVIHQLGKEIKAKNKPYLRFNIGGRWASKKSVIIPARPFMMVQDEDWEKIREAILKHLVE